jgi:flagellar L-ring protein precursor FlgH
MKPIVILIAVCGLARPVTCAAQAAPPVNPPDESASSSLMASAPLVGAPANVDEQPHALRSVSLFAIAPPEPRTFQQHDLVQIIVRETSQAKSTHDLETDKESRINGGINAWPDLNLRDLLNLRASAGRSENLPAVDLDFTKEFKGEGDYKRKDDLTARLTAEVIEVLPNGNLVLEARTHIKTDEEEQTIKVTGICRPDDITAANTILSNQIHDLTIDKMHKGELRKTTQKGIIAKVLDAVFAF